MSDREYKRFAGQSVNNAGYHNHNWDLFHNGNELRDVSFPSLAAAIKAIGSEQKTLYITTKHRITSKTEIPANISIKGLNGGSFAIPTGITLRFIGPFSWGRHTAFTGLGTVAFDLGSVDGICPEWRYGGRADGVTDSSDSLVWAASYATTQISGIPMSLAGGQYLYSKTIRIVRHVQQTGAVLIAIAGASGGSGFKYASNPYTLTTAPAPTGGIYGSTFGCTVVIQDGGSIRGLSIMADPSLDTLPNAGTWLVNLEGNFGKNPLEDARINGYTGGRYLGGVIVRNNTTSQIGNFMGSYFSEGLLVDSCNLCSFGAIAFEFIRRGGVPFHYYQSSHCSVDGNWAEGVQSGMVCHYYESCANMPEIQDLLVGEPEGGSTLSGTAANAGDVISFSGTALTDQFPYWENGDEVYFNTVVAGLSLTSLYYIINKGASSFQVSLMEGGAAEVITADGAVNLSKAPSEAVRVTNCADLSMRGLRIDWGGERWIKGRTWLTGSSTRIEFDENFMPRQSVANTHSIRPNTHKYKFQTPPNQLVDLSDTTVYMWLGFIPNGTTLSMDIWSESGAITAPAFEVFRLSSGSTYTSQGTMTGGDISGSGNRVTVSFTFTSEGPFYIRPAGGSGYVHLYYDWNLTYSEALVT